MLSDFETIHFAPRKRAAVEGRSRYNPLLSSLTPWDPAAGGDPNYSPDPGHVGGFGVLVDGIGRGLPRAVACGREFTLVATYPYEGPVMEVSRDQGKLSRDAEIGLRLGERASSGRLSCGGN